MFYFIKGKIYLKTPTYVIIENNGVGYFVEVSLQTSQRIEEGEEIMLYLSHFVSEDKINLYGFKEKEERELFQLLVTVPGIGPKVALRILSGLTTEEIYHGIVSEDVNIFKNVPGIGKKTAERMIVELKQKVEKIPILVDNYKEKELISNAIEALIILGYKRREALNVVMEVVKDYKDHKKSLTIEELIKEALKKMSWKKG
ncbi:MAG: Holliday junction branch migration protein RuvA [Candidatus Omnitrophica bacterium]|nr:Holliday junction branch migration protein RuvA [Candidatus Omnitrophota bacterium]MCM8807112.1 Holliday junction branch migration protein RuvA [Candidatus Omnitrophota bacterium]